MNLASFKKSTKVIGLVFLVIILLLATVFLGKGATNLFSRASSCDAQSVSAAQLSANSAVINWSSNDVSQGMVQYGTTVANLNLSAPEGSSGKIHNVPLTLLTPNTVYYYLISIGNNKCDSSGRSCSEANCVPWSFTTAAITPQPQIVAPILSPTVAIPTPSAALAASPSLVTSPTSVSTPSSSSSATLSAFCQQVKENIGANNTDAARWAILKDYDIDGNGSINAMDVLRCPKTGK